MKTFKVRFIRGHNSAASIKMRGYSHKSVVQAFRAKHPTLTVLSTQEQ